LIKIFQPKYEQSKDADLRDRILKLLDRAENCNTNEFYMQLAEESFKANPTAAAGATLANAFYGQKNYAKSLEYYEKAAGLETNQENKAEYYYNIAVIQLNEMKSCAQARSYALKALEQ